MESGAILDSQIRASSEWDINVPVQQARLHFVKTVYGAWSAKFDDIHQWLQVDLLNTTRVSGVATQGRNGCPCDQWVTKYKLQYSEDGPAFKFYRRSGDESDMVGNNKNNNNNNNNNNDRPFSNLPNRTSLFPPPPLFLGKFGI